MKPLSPGQQKRDDRTRVAITWARLFIREAKRDLNREPNRIIRASVQTVAAIESIYDLTADDFKIKEEKSVREKHK